MLQTQKQAQKEFFNTYARAGEDTTIIDATMSKVKKARKIFKRIF
jgi:hypothetical protein